MDIRRIHVRAHVIKKIEERFSLGSGEEILEFLKDSLRNVKVNRMSDFRISLISESNGTCIQAQLGRDPQTLILMTIIALETVTNYQLRKQYYDNLKEQTFSKLPLIFCNQDLQSKNIIKDKATIVERTEEAIERISKLENALAELAFQKNPSSQIFSIDIRQALKKNKVIE